MSHSNISIFVPHVGCPHMCAFCNQRTITGTAEIPHADDVKRVCAQALNEVKNPSDTEIAFFGGSFTAIPRDYMLELLSAAYDFLGEDKFKGIRLSTRPDYINVEVLEILKKYGVTSIELGAQSLSDKVLTANERGHSSADVANASKLIKEYGFELGLQMMIGLYKSTAEDEFETVQKIVSLSPDTVRIYPVVILENTKLGELYKSGEYKPFDFDTCIDITARAMQSFVDNGIRVIKVGLHASEFVEEQKLGGFYHPALREICEGRIYLEKLKKIIDNNTEYAEISVPACNLSKAIGQKKCNVKYFADKGIELKIVACKNQQEELKLQKKIDRTAVK